VKAYRKNAVGILLVILVSIVLLSLGCETWEKTKEGTGGAYHWTMGELSREYAVTFDDAWNASVQAVKSLELEIAGFTRDELGGEMHVARGDGREMTILLKSLGINLTQVVVHFGVFRDRTACERVHETILETLQSSGKI